MRNLPTVLLVVSKHVHYDLGLNVREENRINRDRNRITIRPSCDDDVGQCVVGGFDYLSVVVDEAGDLIWICYGSVDGRI